MAIKEDCCYLKRPKKGGRRSCVILITLLCKERDCPFHKTFEQWQEQNRKYGYRLKREVRK